MTTTIPQPRPARTGTEQAAVRTVDVRKTYGSGDAAVHALAGVTVDLYAGQFTAVMGPSGSGKSTLMHVTAGLDTVTSGTVWIGDTDLTTLKDKAPDPAAPRPGRLRVPAVQPGADAVGRGEHRAADAARRPHARPGLAGPGDRRRRARRPPEAPAERALRRPAAAGRRRPGLGGSAGGRLRRRAHRQPRLALRRRGADVPAPLGRRDGPDDRHGHP